MTFEFIEPGNDSGETDGFPGSVLRMLLIKVLHET